MKSFIAALVAVIFSTSLALAAQEAGSAVSVQGAVTLQRGGKNYRLSQGTKLYVGDTISPGQDSYAKLIMADESLLTVGAKSSFRIESFQRTDTSRTASMRLFFGKVRAIVSKFAAGKSEYRFLTPTAVAGVRGTHLIVEYDSATKTSRVSVLEGSVGFRSAEAPAAGEVVVGTQQRSEAAPGQSASTPVKMSNDEVQKLNQEIAKQQPSNEPSSESKEKAPAQDNKSNGQGGAATPGGSEDEQGGEEQGGEGDQGADVNDQVEQNIDRVEQTIQQTTPTNDTLPAEDPAANTGVRVRW